MPDPSLNMPQARLNRYNPQAGRVMETYTSPSGSVYVHNHWNPVTRDVAEQLAQIRQRPGDPNSPLAFTIARDGKHAIAIEQQERSVAGRHRSIAPGSKARSFHELRDALLERDHGPDETGLLDDGIFATKESVTISQLETITDVAEHLASRRRVPASDTPPGHKKRRRRRRRRRKANAAPATNATKPNADALRPSTDVRASTPPVKPASAVDEPDKDDIVGDGTADEIRGSAKRSGKRDADRTAGEFSDNWSGSGDHSDE